MNYLEEYSELNDRKERLSFLSNLLSFCSQKVLYEDQELEMALEENEKRLREANARIARAKEVYLEAKADVESAEKRTKREVYKQLQTVRDRIYAIGETASLAGEKMQGSAKYKVSADELNNIIDSVSAIIDELRTLDLWREGDYVPPLKKIDKNVEPKKSSRKKKSLPAEDNFAEAGIQQQLTLE